MRDIAKEIRESMEQALAITEGTADPSTYRVHIPERVDVKAIRKSLGMTQQTFAAAFGFSLATLRKWEQERREPEGPARAYLKVILRRPDAVREALAEPIEPRHTVADTMP